VYMIVKNHKEIRWSEIARRAIEDYAKKIEFLNTMTAQSDLSEEDIMTLDTKVKSGIHQHYGNKASRIKGKKPDSS
jgi:hypothetical protein